MNRGLDRRVGGLAESANGGIFHREADLVEKRDLLGYAANRFSAGDSVQRLFLADSSHAAGNALPAGLIAEERCDTDENVGHVDAVVEHDNDAGAERRLGGACALERERHVELVRSDENARRAAEQNRLY